MKKAIFLDIDGTLINSHEGVIEISPKVKEALYTLQKQGHYIFIATGRPYAFLSAALLEFGFNGFILSNGAHVIIDNKTIYKSPMSNSFINELVDVFEKNNVQYTLQGEEYSYSKEDFNELYNFYEEFGIYKEKFNTKYKLEDIDVYKIEMLCPNKESLQYCLDIIKDKPEYDYFSSVSDVHLEMYFKENTKAVAILKALEFLEIPIENTYAFGDGKNDIEMLDVVGCGIAMGNASDEVKKYANKITDTVSNDGVAIGIEEYILI